MDFIRLTYWLLLSASFALMGHFNQAHAETIPATEVQVWGPRTVANNNCGGTTTVPKAYSIQEFADLFFAHGYPATLFGSPAREGCSSNGDAWTYRDGPHSTSGNTINFNYKSCTQLTSGPNAGQWTCGPSTPTSVTQTPTTEYQCPSGYTLEGTSCVGSSPCEAKKDQVAMQGLIDGGTSLSSPDIPPLACDGTCQVVVADADFPVSAYLDAGVRHYMGNVKYVFTGESCSGASDIPSASPSTPPSTCGEGQTMGTYNGKTTCVNVSTGQPAPTTPPPPATETEQTDPPVTNPDGSTTTTTTTTHTDGSTTTTTTTTNPDGSTSTSVVKTPAPDSDELDNFCENNPDATICKEEPESSWSGGCGSFACEGDAVQCAIAKKIHQDRCDDEASLEPFADAKLRGEQLLNGELGPDVDGWINGTDGSTDTVYLPEALSESGTVALSGSGLTDLAVAFQGQTIVIPFSKLNSILEMLGYIILACSYVAALRIVGVS